MNYKSEYPVKDELYYLLAEHGFNDREILEISVMLKWTYPSRDCYYNELRNYMMSRRGCVDKNLINKILDLLLPLEEIECKDSLGENNKE